MAKKDIVLAAGDLPPGIVTDFTVTKDDVLAIFVSKKEQELLTEKEAADKRIESIVADLEKADEELGKAVKSAAEELFGSTLEKVNKLLKEAGFNSKLVPSACLGEKDGKKVLELTFHGSCSDEAVKPLTPSVRQAVGVIDDLKKQAEQAEKDAIAARQQLAKLPAEERRVRAKLATRALTQTDAGRAFLKSFEE